VKNRRAGKKPAGLRRPFANTGSNALWEEIREYVTLWDVPWDDARASFNHESLE
jgi:hypothetical protein